MGGSDLGLFESNEAARLVQEVAHPEANSIFGAVIDDALGDEARVTVIAAGFDDADATSKPPAAPAANQAPAQQRPVAPVAGATSGASAAPAASSQDTAPQQRVEQKEEEELPEIIESDYSGKKDDDLDVPDFLK